jgi:long-chain acyl-CoA synthetase
MQLSATTLNLASIIEHHALTAPDKEAIVWNEMRFTYGQLNGLANRVANAIVEMGIGHDDKVALVCPNLPFFPIVYYAIMKTGAVVVPLSTLLKPREVVYHLRDSDAKAVFVFEGTPELPLGKTVKEAFDQVETCENMIVMTIDPLAPCAFGNCRSLTEITKDQPETFDTFPTAPNDTCAILYTSGTTGQPKGAELTHLNLITNITTTYGIHLPVLDFTDNVQKTALITLPLFHTTGQTVQMNVNL